MPKVKVNDIEMNYEVRGEGEPIIFIHGSGASWKMWKPQIEQFSKKYKMIMIDMRGHGESSRHFPNDEYSMKLIAQDLKLFLDVIGIDKTHIVGLSQGSVIAQLFAIKHSSYINRLVLSNGYSEIPTRTSKWVLNISNAIMKLIPYDIIIKLMLKVYKDDEFTKKVLRDSFSIDKEMLLKIKTSEFPTHTDELYNITCPTLVMGGDMNIMGVDERKASETIYEHIPNATLALFKNAFDPLSTMKWEIFNDMILDFLEGKPIKQYEEVRLTEKKK
ncbi:alpha/beta fold hydrolase [Cytobacillus dafuensis]|uniref:Alpha/beta hydrolase n=1 Tax=Cytobacillus dafuensis TaxID=1742359 RepID=A0A5B8Z869_CYTDA|nr:alpha/beta hydrolase [Cytobacillus dafuensis]QED49285.1 alpha/beta hydrolase [Cytobacillus dafuensis]